MLTREWLASIACSESTRTVGKSTPPHVDARRRAREMLRWARQQGIFMLSPMEGFPSLAAEIGGSGISSRWWSHARANDIYNAFRDLSENKDILTTKLIDGKVTLVHQDLWPSVVRLALDPVWRGRQVRSLNKSSKTLFDTVERMGQVRLDFLAPDWPSGRKALNKDRTALEKRALVVSHDEHTETGAHEAVLESWDSFRKRSGMNVSELSRDSATDTLARFLRGKKSPFA